jgi:hypothetical protein
MEADRENRHQRCVCAHEQPRSNEREAWRLEAPRWLGTGAEFVGAPGHVLERPDGQYLWPFGFRPGEIPTGTPLSSADVTLR